LEGPGKVVGKLENVNMHHEQLEYSEGVNQRGYRTFVWRCTCGRKGSGSLTAVEARAGWVKHARGRAIKAQGQGW